MRLTSKSLRMHTMCSDCRHPSNVRVKGLKDIIRFYLSQNFKILCMTYYLIGHSKFGKIRCCGQNLHLLKEIPRLS